MGRDLIHENGSVTFRETDNDNNFWHICTEIIAFYVYFNRATFQISNTHYSEQAI